MKNFKENENIVVFTCEKNGNSLEEFLMARKISSRLFKKLYRYKNILVNGQHRRKDLPVRTGDKVVLVMEDESNNIIPEDIKLDIIYEDFDLLILNKPENMIVHTTQNYETGTLSNGISHYFKKKEINKKVRFVNRLDMDTTGILIVAKNPFAHQQLALQFEEEEVLKKYLTIVEGRVEDDQGTIDFPIGEKDEVSKRRKVDKDGQRAVTKYIVKEHYLDKTLLEVQIITGRTHQIRVHLSHIGHPIVGDSLYYKESAIIGRQALHSYYLKIKHPRTGDDIEFLAALPKDMEELISYIKE